MGAVCSGGTLNGDSEFGGRFSSFSGRIKRLKSFRKQKKVSSNSFSSVDDYGSCSLGYHSGEFPLSISRELKPMAQFKTEHGKVTQKSSFLGKAGAVGLEKAKDVLDTLGSSVSEWHSHSGFIHTTTLKGYKISILAFEVANTIAKGASLLQSLSEENIQFLKNEMLDSEGVQLLVTTDMDELMNIAAADKRDEFEIFSREVVRFGDLCRDPQWHNLGRYFSKLDLENLVDEQLGIEAEKTMQELTALAHNTSELYHELNTLDRFEQDYRRKRNEVEALHHSEKGESLVILHSEVKQQRKLVRSLKKKSLWTKNLEEVVRKLVDIVTYIHQAIVESFGNSGMKHKTKEPTKSSGRLGPAGLALHYANIINQIDNVASRPTFLPANMRDTLYQGLPMSVKGALRSRIYSDNSKEDLTLSQVKAEMEKILQWLVPVATNTTKAHQGFGWVGEWAHLGNEINNKSDTQKNLIRLQTLYHADKQKTDLYILELVTWLHHLISLVRQRDNGFRPLPSRSPTCKDMSIQSTNTTVMATVRLSQEDINLLNDVTRRKWIRGVSKSQEFIICKKRRTQIWALSRSTGSSPRRELSTRRCIDNLKGNYLDVMDGLDSEFM